MTQPKRLDRPLNSLRLPSPVSEASLDALREPSEELESADRPRRRQELLSPITDFVAGIGLMPLDIVGKVWLLIGAIVDRQGLGGISSIEFSGSEGKSSRLTTLSNLNSFERPENLAIFEEKGRRATAGKLVECWITFWLASIRWLNGPLT